MQSFFESSQWRYPLYKAQCHRNIQSTSWKFIYNFRIEASRVWWRYELWPNIFSNISKRFQTTKWSTRKLFCVNVRGRFAEKFEFWTKVSSGKRKNFQLSKISGSIYLKIIIVQFQGTYEVTNLIFPGSLFPLKSIRTKLFNNYTAKLKGIKKPVWMFTFNFIGRFTWSNYCWILCVFHVHLNRFNLLGIGIKTIFLSNFIPKIKYQ